MSEMTSTTNYELETMSCSVYNKRSGTSGIRGQLYEINLISLIHFRAIHDDSVEEIHLASNVNEIGAFDDICFKAKLKGFDRPLVVFIQAKHKDNEKHSLIIDIAKYFESYLYIREKFHPGNKDVLFEEKFDETKCLFVMYTNARVDFEKDVIGSILTTKLNDLIGTGGTAKQTDTSKIDIMKLIHDKKRDEIMSKILSRDHNEIKLKDKENLAKDFLNKLRFYSNQANETIVEDMLKKKIEDYQSNHKNNFEIRTEAIFLKYHKEIKNWWMTPDQASYLTKNSGFFDNAMNIINKAPLVSVINMMYEMKHIYYTFNKDALESLKLLDQHSRTVIITESSALTVAKVIQCSKNKDHVVLDLENIVNLPAEELCLEFKNTNEQKILIFVCDKIESLKHVQIILGYIAKAVHDKNTIIITNKMSDVLDKYFLKADNVYYEKYNLIDFSEESQKSILKSATVIFQGKEVTLDDLVLDDELLTCVQGEVLSKIINNETIVVGKAMGNSTYDEIKYLYVDRRIKKTKERKERNQLPSWEHDNSPKVIKSFYDIVDDVVIVTAAPGMGKSTLLTHLSLKTKELEPKVWILRINLLEYSREFSMWKKDETDIDVLETLNFMCQVILRDKLGKENTVNIELEEVNSDVHLTYCTGDQETVFELKLFLHFYNRENLILLFDGFDEICPHYTNEVIKFLKIVSNCPRKHRTWVTSRSYNEVITILQQEFDTFYDLEPFSPDEKNKYLDKFWKSNLILKEFDKDQLENVHDFMNFMSENVNSATKFFMPGLLEIYINVFNYFVKEIKGKRFLKGVYNCECGKFNAPLLLHLIAAYLQNEIKDVRKTKNKWNVDTNNFTFYESFIENKLKIRFQEKNKMDIYNPDIMTAYEKEHADFLAKHKKLAAYAIFPERSDFLFNTSELKDVKDTIKLIEEGKEKTGLIHSAVNGIPIFIHWTFTEYFAVEYVCDSVKSENCSQKLQLWMDFIFNPNLRQLCYFFDCKMKIDKELTSVLKKNEEVIFVIIIETGKVYLDLFKHNKYKSMSSIDKIRFDNIHHWSLCEAVNIGLHNVLSFYMRILKIYVNEGNLNDFLEIISGTAILAMAYRKNCDIFIITVLDIVREIDKFKLNSVVFDNICFVPFMNYDAMTSKKIMAYIHLFFEIEKMKSIHVCRNWKCSCERSSPYVCLQE